MLYDVPIFKLSDVRFVGFFTIGQYSANVAYVVDWAIEPEVPDAGLRNEQTLIISNISALSIIKRR